MDQLKVPLVILEFGHSQVFSNDSGNVRITQRQTQTRSVNTNDTISLERPNLETHIPWKPLYLLGCVEWRSMVEAAQVRISRCSRQFRSCRLPYHDPWHCWRLPGSFKIEHFHAEKLHLRNLGQIAAKFCAKFHKVESVLFQ